MTKLQQLMQTLEQAFENTQVMVSSHVGEVTIEVDAEHILAILTRLKNHSDLQFDTLIDVCAVDYLDYGNYQWTTDNATSKGFCRAVNKQHEWLSRAVERPRFAVVYHLLSTALNQRIRVRCYCEDDDAPMIDSAADIYAAANWFEREAYDLFGILFKGHPDLRRILTDYGFIGHPFRKDFPVSGHVEMRYDAKSAKVIYEPVDIPARVLVPKVGRDDNRYIATDEE